MFSPTVVPVMELVPFLLFCCLSSLHYRAIGLGMSWAPAVAPLAKVVRAISVEMPILLLALRAMIAGGGCRGVGGRGAMFWVWLISRAFAPCSVGMDVHIKHFKVVDNALSCEVGMDEVRDEEFFRVPDDI